MTHSMTDYVESVLDFLDDDGEPAILKYEVLRRIQVRLDRRHEFIEGDAYEQMLVDGTSTAELARRLAQPRARIQQCIALLHAHPTLQDAYKRGVIGWTQARTIATASSIAVEDQPYWVAWVVAQPTISGPDLKAVIDRKVFDDAVVS